MSEIEERDWGIERAKEAVREFYTSSTADNITESLDEAMKALREQAEREKGCVCCGLIYKLDGASYGTDSVIIENRFCPMCGKRLEVEP